jgi:hypothetical protein
MSEKSNTAVVIVIVVLAVLMIPCILGTFLVGGALMWKQSAPMQPVMEPRPSMKMETDSAPAAKGESSESAPAITESPKE